MKKKLGKVLALSAAMALTVSSFAGCSSKNDTTTDAQQGTDSKTTDNKKTEKNTTSEGNDTSTDGWEAARTDTYTPYPETVNFTIGVTVRADVAYPEGSTDTAEDSAFTRFMKAKLNIQSTNEFEAADGEDFNQKVSMAITSGDIPDIMNVRYEDFIELVQNDMVEDLTEAYNNCASDLMKDIYASNDNRSLDMATIDGKLYAIPTTNISSGPEMLWLRGDWMDKLGLSDPQTLEDVENIVKAFIEKDPGNNGEGKTVGIPICIEDSNWFYSAYSSAYRLCNLFSSFGAIPEQWIEGADGTAVYGSVQPEMKPALQLISDWYKEGILDQQFAIRTYDDIKALVTNGECGSYFCGWWAPYDLAANYQLEPEAEWRAYVLPTAKDGKVTMWGKDPNQSYTVVRKGFEYPELIVKAKSLTLDYNQGDAAYTDTSKECQEYIEYVSNGYGVEVIGGFDWWDAAAMTYQRVSEALDGTRDPKNMTAYENTLYTSCKGYLDSVNKNEQPSKDNWCDYMNRIYSLGIVDKTEVNMVQPVFFGRTTSMNTMWESLKTLERETILKIITGDMSIDEFDDFVQRWKNAGGDIITQEVNETIK